MFSLPWGPVRLEKNTCTEWILKKNINNSGIFNLHLSCSTFALIIFVREKNTKHLPTLNILPLLATCLLGVFLFVGDRLTRPDKPVATGQVHRGTHGARNEVDGQEDYREYLMQKDQS